MRIIGLFALFLVAPANCGDFSPSARGTTTAQFLELGVGARAISMGEAYSAVADEAGAMYWNPAALTNIQNHSVTLMHGTYIGSSYLDYGAYGQKVGSRGAFGAGLQYFSAGGIAQTGAAGNDIGTFKPRDLAFSLGYAYKFGELSIGLTGKFIQSKILTTAQTGALDFGLLSPVYFERLKLAFTVTNLGGKMRFDEKQENLPLNFKLGSSYKIADRWLAALDINAPRDKKPYAALGMEHQFATNGPLKFAGRAGVNSETLGSVEGFTGVSAGFGIGYKGVLVDYSISPMGGLGQAHRLSLTHNF